MKYTIEQFEEAIRKLPLQTSYKKEQVLIPEFLVEKENNIEIYYAPHNEYINPKAKLFIIGITPGFQQMSAALAAAREGFEEGFTKQEIQKYCKRQGRFSGSLRKNIITMLDQIGLPAYYGLTSSSELFEEKEELLHTVSLIPYSVFVKGTNYTGHTPKLMKSEFLMKYVHQNFIEEYESIEEKERLLLIPLGRAVEEALLSLKESGELKGGLILTGFPHPSGANVNRLVQLEQNKPYMMKYLEENLGKEK